MTVSEEVMIPGTRTKRRTLRIFTTLHNHKRSMKWVDFHLTDGQIDVHVPDGYDGEHEKVIMFLKEWRATTGVLGKVVIAYQVLDIETIKDNRNAWQHEPCRSVKETEVGKQVFVFGEPWVKFMTLAELERHARFIAGVGEDGPPSSEYMERHVLNRHTPTAYAYLASEENAPEARLLQLSAVAFIVFNSEKMEFLPDPSLSDGITF